MKNVLFDIFFRMIMQILPLDFSKEFRLYFWENGDSILVEVDDDVYSNINFKKLQNDNEETENEVKNEKNLSNIAKEISTMLQFLNAIEKEDSSNINRKEFFIKFEDETGEMIFPLQSMEPKKNNLVKPANNDETCKKFLNENFSSDEEDDDDECYINIKMSSILVDSVVNALSEIKEFFWEEQNFQVLYNAMINIASNERKKDEYLFIRKNGYLNDKLLAKAWYHLLRLHKSDYAFEYGVDLETLDVIIFGFTNEFRKIVKPENSMLFEEVKAITISNEYKNLIMYLLVPK